MIRHKKEHDVKQSESEASASEDEWSDRYRDNQFKRSSGHRRQSSDTTHDRSPNRDGEGRRRRRRHYDDSDDDVEVLPDRFDSHGRPLDGSGGGSRKSRFVTRSGEFHRPAQRPGDMEVHGGWQLGGTDPEQIERLVRTVTGVLEGRKSWVSVIGEEEVMVVMGMMRMMMGYYDDDDIFLLLCVDDSFWFSDFHVFVTIDDLIAYELVYGREMMDEFMRFGFVTLMISDIEKSECLMLTMKFMKL
ncbi:hypothetical protein V8C26DRAFT_143027 [Trichoderma gracile]